MDVSLQAGSMALGAAERMQRLAEQSGGCRACQQGNRDATRESNGAGRAMPATPAAASPSLSPSPITPVCPMSHLMAMSWSKVPTLRGGRGNGAGVPLAAREPVCAAREPTTLAPLCWRRGTDTSQKLMVSTRTQREQQQKWSAGEWLAGWRDCSSVAAQHL